MKIFTLLLSFLTTLVVALKFDTSAPRVNDFRANGDPLIYKAPRMYVPYGPDLTTSPPQSTQPWTGYGYGMGATEHIAYDYKEKYIYSQSEAGGFITVIDFESLPGTVTEYSIEYIEGRNVDVRDIVVCPEEGLLFATLSDRDKVLMYETVKRSDPKIPTLIKEIDAGNSPDAMKLSNDCSHLAVANQNDGPLDTSFGSLTLISNFRAGSPTVQTVSFDGFDDAYLLGKNVHMPLTQNALEYWNGQAQLGYEALVNDWNPTLVLDPEFIAFNDQGTEIFLNLQENSAVVRIDVSTATATAINGYGLKDMRNKNIDIVDDGECNFIASSCLYLNRAPDGIATVEVDGEDYLLLAEEGSDFDLNDDFGEKFDTTEFFLGNGTVAFAGITLGPGVAECSANFDEVCEDNPETSWCSDFEMTIGTSGINYNDPSAPVVEKIVGIGGRGLSIYKVPRSADDDIEFIWESESQFEQETCDKFPWANNAVMDEEFAPSCDVVENAPTDCARYAIFNNEDDRGDIEDRNTLPPAGDGCEFEGGVVGACPMGQAVDEKAQEDGLAVEAVAVGVACDHLVAVACGENNGMCLLYDITNINSPQLLQTFHLSPVSETKNPQQSYRVDLGDIDSETILFLPYDQSPTGSSGFLFAGAISGTLSFYEFQCAQPERSSFESPAEDDDDGISGGGIAGVVIAGVFAIILLSLLLCTVFSRGSRGVESGGGKRGEGVEPTDTTNYA